MKTEKELELERKEILKKKDELDERLEQISKEEFEISRKETRKFIGKFFCVRGSVSVGEKTLQVPTFYKVEKLHCLFGSVLCFSFTILVS